MPEESLFTCMQFHYTRFGGLVAFLVYMVTTYTLYVPDWSYDGPESKVTVMQKQLYP